MTNAKLHVVHTNDMHNHFPKETLLKLKTPSSLLLDSGDALRGSNTLYYHNEPILQSMNVLGYQAMAMGNREFHYIRKVLRARIATIHFPILSANVVDLAQKLKLLSHVIIEIEGIRIGLFGLTVPQFPVGSLWERITSWRFLNPIETAKEKCRELKELGAHIIFCLSHLGFPYDQKLAEAVPEIHVIFGGHSHTVLTEPYWVNQTAIIHGGSHGLFVGNWQVKLSFNGSTLESCHVEGQLVPT